MIDLYYWTTPNGHKLTIFLEEAKLPYQLHPINIGKGEQFAPEFLRISPNNKIPAIVDNSPNDGGKPFALFESGAILLYLADKIGKFISPELRQRNETLQWLFWQVGGLGPMAGQNVHFNRFASEKIPYAMDRYLKETTRLFTVLNQQLTNHEFIVKEYSIADMACYPWIAAHEKLMQNLNDFPQLKRWQQALETRPAIQRAYAIAKEVNPETA